MSTEVALRRSDVPAAFTEQMHMARVLSESDLLPKQLRGRPANVLVILQGARALDVAGFWALQSMHVVDGRLGMAAELMRALVIRAGHRFTVVERTMERAVVEIKRSDRDKPYRAEFTWEDAKAAKLSTKDNWVMYRKSMLVARATSIAVRDECADVMFGVVYTPDELGAVTDEEGAPVIDGSVVEPLDLDEVRDAANTLEACALEDLPAAWGRVTDRASADALVPGNEDEPPATLRGYLGGRLGLELFTCGTKADVRQLWEVGRALKVMDMPLAYRTPEGEERTEEFGAILKRLGEMLPETTTPAEPEPEVTEHAREMQAAAAASWDDVEAVARDVNLAAREQVFDELHEINERRRERG